MDFIQKYFEGFRDAGYETVFQIFRMKGQNVIEKIPFDHCHYDGVSALVELARRYPEDGFEAPRLKVPMAPSWGKRLKELAKWYARFYPFMPAKWQVRSGKNEKVCVVKEILDWPREHRYPLNMRLLKSLDMAARPFLEKSKKNRVWMTPVGLYQGIDRHVTPANRVSFIDLKLFDETSIEELQQDSTQQLRSLSYWGTILTMYPAVWMGKTLFKIFAKYVHLSFRRTGTFSNMGEWTIPGLAQDEWWTIGRGVVAKMSPVEATAIIINGRLGLSLHFDESLRFTEDDAQCMMQNWQDSFLQC